MINNFITKPFAIIIFQISPKTFVQYSDTKQHSYSMMIFKTVWKDVTNAVTCSSVTVYLKISIAETHSLRNPDKGGRHGEIEMVQ